MIQPQCYQQVQRNCKERLCAHVHCKDSGYRLCEPANSIRNKQLLKQRDTGDRWMGREHYIHTRTLKGIVFGYFLSPE